MFESSRRLPLPIDGFCLFLPAAVYPFLWTTQLLLLLLLLEPFSHRTATRTFSGHQCHTLASCRVSQNLLAAPAKRNEATGDYCALCTLYSTSSHPSRPSIYFWWSHLTRKTSQTYRPRCVAFQPYFSLLSPLVPQYTNIGATQNKPPLKNHHHKHNNTYSP